MKHCIFLFLLLPVLTTAQDAGSYDYNKNSSIKASREPFYPGGEMALYELVFNKLEYPRNAIDMKLKGELQVNFNVNPDSTLSDFAIVQQAGHGVDEAIIDILKPLKFAPGIINGKAVTKNMLMSFPVEAE